MIDCEKTAEQLVHEISELLIRCEILEKEASEYTPVVSVAAPDTPVAGLAKLVQQFLASYRAVGLNSFKIP